MKSNDKKSVVASCVPNICGNGPHSKSDNNINTSPSTLSTLSSLLTIIHTLDNAHIHGHGRRKSTICPRGYGNVHISPLFAAIGTRLARYVQCPVDCSLTAGAPSFLLLSLLFTLHHFAYSTLRLLCKNTLLAPLISVLSMFSPAISAGCVLITLYYYLYPPTNSYLGHVLVNVWPYLYASILRWVSPLFTLIEGVSTLLVIQLLGRAGKGWADDDEKEEGFEWRALVGLVFASLVYCSGLYLIVWSFPSAPMPAFLLGAALTATLFLSFIGFSLRRTNVLETSLVLFYVAYSAWLSGAERAME